MLAEGEVVSDGPTREVVVASPAFAPQVAKVLAPQPWLTVAEVARARCGPDERAGAPAGVAAARGCRAVRLRAAVRAGAARSSARSGVLAFGWPLLVQPGLAASPARPTRRGCSSLLLPLLLAVVLAEIADGGMDAKAVALLGVLAAVGAALRPLGGGVGRLRAGVLPAGAGRPGARAAASGSCSGR